MKCEIKSVNGHYELYANGLFHGSYDTFLEAAKELDILKADEGSAA